MSRAAEAAATAAAGAVLGFAAGRPLGLGAAMAAVGGVNGAISGYRAVYRWSHPSGWLAWALDSTWATPTTAAALVSHAGAIVRGDPQYCTSLSRRQNRHVYGRGVQPRPGFLVTLGNVVSNVGDTASARRRRLVTDHEDVHVWQARWFGPMYPVLYVGWMAAGGVVGAAVWIAGRRRSARFASASFGRVVESCAYYLNPFEWWAYSRDDHWPPAGKVAGLGWRGPAVRAFGGSRAAPR